MQITLINCNVHLLAIGIDMKLMGSGELLASHLPHYQSWEYDFDSDTLLVTVDDGTTPDLSILGEVS